jgi:hypothetical protein
MKKTNKVVTTFEVTADEMRENLALYQADMLAELMISHLGSEHTITERTKFMLKLLQKSEHSGWFQDLIERHDIRWVLSPESHDHLLDLIINYPFIFGIGQEIEELTDLNGFNEKDFEVYVDGTLLDSKTIWENI